MRRMRKTTVVVAHSKIRAESVQPQENLTQVTDSGCCCGASFPERHKYLALYAADFCPGEQPNLAAFATVTPMQHDPR